MNYLRRSACAICREEQSGDETRFLLAENQWEDKLTVLQWNEHMASRPGVLVACNINHVEELVIHWMTTGSLDYPFARTAVGSRGWLRPTMPHYRVDLSGTRQLGELAVHRESMERVLAENPESLQAMLDALLDALRQETVSESDSVIEREEEPEPVEARVLSWKPETRR